MIFTHFANGNSSPGFSISGTLVEYGLNLQTAKIPSPNALCFFDTIKTEEFRAIIRS